MSKFEFTKLKDVCSYASEKILLAEITEDTYISTENMLPGKNGVTRATALPNMKNVPKYVADDVLTSNIRPYFKKIWRAKSAGGASNDVLILRSNYRYRSDFLYYVLSSDDFFAYSMQSSKGTKMPRGNKDAIMKYPVPVVDIDVQHKIASTLSAYDNLIENNNCRIAILEEMAQRLYQDWFVHFRFPGHEKVKMVESEMGLIPERWVVSSIGSISDKIFSGGTPTTTQEEYWDGSFHWLSSGETRDKFIISTEKRITEEGIKNSSTRLAKRLDIVIASAGQGKTRGQTSLLLLDTYINQSVISIRVKDYCKAYAFFNISSRYDELRHISDASSIRGSLTTQIFNSLSILLPDTNVLQQYNSIVVSNILLIENLRKRNEILRKTRDLLLPRLISGDIDVSELDIGIERSEENA